jgi:hypothetical protein
MVPAMFDSADDVWLPVTWIYVEVGDLVRLHEDASKWLACEWLSHDGEGVEYLLLLVEDSKDSIEGGRICEVGEKRPFYFLDEALIEVWQDRYHEQSALESKSKLLELM